MKNIGIPFLVFSMLLASCANSTDKKTGDTGDTAVPTVVRDSVHKDLAQQGEVSTGMLSVDLATLVPIDLLDSKKANSYERYGIEFSGNCYACDLARLSVTKDKMIFTNVCDGADSFEIKDFTYTTKEGKTVLKSAERTYTLTLIDKAPVYELVVEGAKLELVNKRLSFYYTTEKALSLFKENGCGDFEG